MYSVSFRPVSVTPMVPPPWPTSVFTATKMPFDLPLDFLARPFS